jgi:hypothetical protein
MRTILLGLAAMAMTATAARAAQAGEPPVVVELFTSQGCSSCPPADAFLTELARTRADVLPLAFHVTYWNYLGWADPFSLEAATVRQREYGRAFGANGVYTPQMVVDGAAEFVGSNRADGLRRIAAAAPKPVAVSLSRDGDTLVAAVGAGAGQGRVLLVGYDAQHQTSVGRGENSGRKLLESNIVRSLTEIAAWSGTAAELRRPVPAGEGFAVLLQAPDGRIIGAARLDRPAA